MMTHRALSTPIVTVPISEGRSFVSEIARFFGIVISMYFREHGVPHFHARYGEFWCSVEIESEAIRGYLPVRARHLVLEWTRLHRRELLENWNLAREERAPSRIAPLE